MYDIVKVMGLVRHAFQSEGFEPPVGVVLSTPKEGRDACVSLAEHSPIHAPVAPPIVMHIDPDTHSAVDVYGVSVVWPAEWVKYESGAVVRR